MAVTPAAVQAQHHRGPYGPRNTVVVGGYHGYPYYYAPYFWAGYPWYPYGFGAYYAQWGYDYPPGTSSIKLEVTPRETEVYIDGYRAGIVDEFDGFFQRMRLGSGEHEIVLYLEGYKSVRQVLKLAPGADFKVRHTMVPLGPGEPNDPRPEAPPIPVPAPDQPRERRPPLPQGRPVPPPPEALPPAVDVPVEATGFGAIAIRVQPAGAEVWIDGDRWEGPESDGRLVVQVGPGTHRVAIRKAGFVSYETDVEVSVRRTATLNVVLPPQR
jgi:hypothetical protein